VAVESPTSPCQNLFPFRKYEGEKIPGATLQTALKGRNSGLNGEGALQK